ncbi:Putative Methyltransferase domain-containing protein [Septoria linicola]|uniref:Methyltransferase domain-containing protein n=1 Tax=Septoria linicola TaxID=215465 RepID=A0A9Q9ARJ6_9PEZI|nr:putative Methyltransferase domain-containing protein [Septoria linicola]USW51220.1 Putative Methyltransferase domain-containing protein [Septoria linicola]
MTGSIGPDRPLPYADEFSSTEEYVSSLLGFVGTDDTLRTLCGGVHILDFFTSTPQLYDRILPQDWRDFFQYCDPMGVVDLLIRDDLSSLESNASGEVEMLPPASLLAYIRRVRQHLLLREPGGSQCSRNRQVKQVQKLARNVAVGMNVKKVHEVGLFASYLDNLARSIGDSANQPVTHLVDFGSGQNYLGRALASEPYNRNIVAIESRQENAERAKEYDVMAKLAVKQKIMRDKKAFRNGFDPVSATRTPVIAANLPTPPPEHNSGLVQRAPEVELATAGRGKIQYVEHRIAGGDLKEVIDRIPDDSPGKNIMVMSLHSCGNLVHHGLRSLLVNPQVRCVAMVGCCYNLVTERLGPATYKLPQLRPNNARLERLGEARDPHGFPMSQRYCEYYDDTDAANSSKGVRLNITSRMMAVQAPSNWGPSDSENFFTRHFYRALLQRIFLDRGVVGPPTPNCVGGVSPAGHSSGGTPIVIGSLRKGCYDSFTKYVRGALEKLMQDSENGALFKEKMAEITDEEIDRYAEEWKEGKKKLSVIWSLMAFSAGVIEAAIVVDRWLWLQEQEEVKEAWVEPVFDYKFSPRNLVVVGIKK